MRKRTTIQWDEDASVAANASYRLAPLVSEYFARGRQLHTKTRAEAFHNFRLQGKRLRYTLELFRGCYGPGMNERLGLLRQVQQALGEMNDCEATLRMITSRKSLLPTHRQRAVRYLEAKSAETRERFLGYWRETFDAAGQEDWWVRYLTKPGLRRKVTRGSQR
jgi:CHAD domain-containing protein